MARLRSLPKPRLRGLPKPGLRSLPRAVCLLGLVLGLAACGKSNHPSTAENDGVYVTAGPITYQLQISRQLNPYATEDRQYITGIPVRAGSVSASQLWYGVFLWAKNQTKRSVATSDDIDIVDTQGTHYYPI